jgi:hypothetical protein
MSDRDKVVSFTQGVMDRIRERMGEQKKGLRDNKKKPLMHEKIEK